MTWLAAHPVLAVIFFIGFLVFVHETGHFLVGKMCGIGVEVYSIGFGPRLFGFRHKGTDYRLAVLPLGGYVKFAGSLPSEEVPERFRGMEMHRAPVLARAMTILAGPLANLILAALIYSVHGYQGVEHPPAKIGIVMPGGAAEKGGLQAGDTITMVDGEPVEHWNQLRILISDAAGRKMQFRVLRNGKEVFLTMTPEAVSAETVAGEQDQGRLGISFGLIPPVLTLLLGANGESPEGESSLQTGDRITSVSYQDKVLSVTTWPEFLQSLGQARRDHADSITFAFKRESKSSDSVPAGQEEEKVYEVTLSTSPWSAQESDKGRVTQLIELAASLGLTDSQLTLREVRKPLDKTLQPGDRVLSLNNQPVASIFDLSEVLQDNRTAETPITVVRGNETLDLIANLEPIEVQKASGKVTMFTFPATFLGQAESPPPYVEKYDSFVQAALYGIKETAIKSGAIVGAIWGLITGTLPLKALGGPMLIAKVAGDAAEAGWQAFFATMAIISIILGMLNLFPIPALDGGQLVLVGAEAFRRRPLTEAAIENFQRVGFVMIMALVVLATYNDLSRFWSSMLKGMTSLFN